MTAFTAEELAELAAYDAAVDAAPVTREERHAARERDRVARAEATGRDLDHQLEMAAKRRERERIRQRTPEVKAQRAAYREAHREENRERCRQYYAANHEAQKAYQKAYRYRHADRINAYQKKYYADNMAKLAVPQGYIRTWREENGISLRKLAKMVGVTVTTIRAWELGRSPAKWDKLAAVGCIKP